MLVLQAVNMRVTVFRVCSPTLDIENAKSKVCMSHLDLDLSR